MSSKSFGALLVVLTVLGIWLYTREHPNASTPAVGQQSQVSSGSTSPTGSVASAKLTVAHGYVGGEKMGFVQNPRVQKILADTYGLELRSDRRGSVEMVSTEPLDGIDFIWPGSQSQSELYARSGRPV